MALNAILADRHFAQKDDVFNTEARFSIIKQPQNLNLSKESIKKYSKKEILEKRENFF